MFPIEAFRICCLNYVHKIRLSVNKYYSLMFSIFNLPIKSEELWENWCCGCYQHSRGHLFVSGEMSKKRTRPPEASETELLDQKISKGGVRKKVQGWELGESSCMWRSCWKIGVRYDWGVFNTLWISGVAKETLLKIAFKKVSRA